MSNILSHIIYHPLLTLGLLIIFISYGTAASKNKKLPQIPLGLFILYLILVLSRRLLIIYNLTEWLPKFDLVENIVIYCAVARFVYYVIVDLWVARKRQTITPKITRDFALAVMFAVIAIIVLHKQGGVNLASLLTTSAVLTMVIGLAAQDTLGNLFSGLAIQTEKPFLIGEWIAFREHVGEVVGITWKSTLIRTPEHEIVYIPNNVISKEIIKNYSRPELRHVAYLEIGIDYDIPPTKVRKVLLETLAEHPEVLKDPPPEVRIISFGDFAITYQIRFWNDDFGNEKLLKADLTNTLWYTLRRNNVQVPFPVRNVRLHHIEQGRAKLHHEKILNNIKTDLQNIPVLAPLPEEDISLLSTKVVVEIFGDGEAIVHKGDAGESMYLIHEGNCDVVIDGKSVTTLKQGNFFGEMSLLTGEPRTATVVAKDDVTLFRVDKAAFGEILKKHPAISETLANALVKRQAALAKLQGKKEEETSQSATNQLVSKIKSFFGLS